MKKIKSLWVNNRIIFVLISILIVCFIAIIVVASTFFFTGNKSNYGDRLNERNNYEITEELENTYVEYLKENKIVNDASFRVSGRIIYISITFETDTSLDEAKSVASASVDKFSEKLLSYYDIDFILNCQSSESSDGFTILGAKNTGGNGIIWNNNNVSEESEN